jgi:hypothetical protein
MMDRERDNLVLNMDRLFGPFERARPVPPFSAVISSPSQRAAG